MKKEIFTVKDLTSSGEGVSSTFEKVTFIDGALPEEVVEAQIVEQKRNYQKAKLITIKDPSKERVASPCPYFGVCGGCQLQHASESLQLQIKRNRIIAALRKTAKIDHPHVDECVRVGDGYGYRNKLTFPLFYQHGKKCIGFFKKRSHEVVDIEACLLHIPFAEKIFTEIRALLLDSSVTFFHEKKKKGDLKHLIIRSSEKEQKVLIGLTGCKAPCKEIKTLSEKIFALGGIKGVVYGWKTGVDNSIYPDHTETLFGDSELREEIIGVDVNISLFSFFQVNKECAEKLYEKAFEKANLTKGSVVLDAYCGVGSFAIFLAKKEMKVCAIESFKQSVIDGKNNAKINQVEIDFICGEVENELKNVSTFDCIFINPPRKGVERSVIEQIAKKMPKKIVYTSCDPQTLSRDVALFCEQGYRFVSASPFDMFSQTMHVETICLLEKN